ncbi:uncharacterized protein SETTUDRAFT_169378 [Exserohilum turcica Et28A]|uniref:Uncharacterized protein n=1 Tax=Exserohilum turcicum (strain 28A) TaxID=671987 RepID=R0ILS0_EXST2|nr:uncharacterized protein SETTUDRAFT_169378 [Exserohilum turcica Et28A]EOA86005.1 hypothetical protein SETTUDRAFT_169378 [Exserohilum turcica Et28A]
MPGHESIGIVAHGTASVGILLSRSRQAMGGAEAFRNRNRSVARVFTGLCKAGVEWAHLQPRLDDKHSQDVHGRASRCRCYRP